MALIDKASLLMVPSTYEAGKLYNVLPSGNRAPDNKGGAGYDQTRADFDFDRGSNAAATRINSSGLIEKYRENLALYSQDFNNAAWAKSSILVNSNTEANPIDGNVDADTITASAGTTQKYIGVSNSVNGLFTYSFYAKYISQQFVQMFVGADAGFVANFDLQNGNQSASGCIATIVSAGNGWYRCSVFFTSTIGSGVYISPVDSLSSPRFSTTSSTNSFYLFGAQLENSLVATEYLNSTSVTAKAGVLVDLPRINYDANGENGALLLEPSRQQLVPYSELFSTAVGWSPQVVGSSTANVILNYGISPDGYQNADRLQLALNGSSYADWLYFLSVTSGTTYTYSVYAKSLSGNVDVEILGGTPTGNILKEITTEWTRLTHTFTANATSIYPRFLLQAGTSSSADILIWGAQLEPNATYVSSYIPNHGTSGGVTRAADSCNNGGSAESINSVEGVLYAEIAALANDGTYRNIALSDGSLTNRILIQYTPNANQINIVIIFSGGQYSLNHTVSNVTEFNKIAIKYKAGDNALWINGFEVDTDTNTLLPSALNTLSFDNTIGDAFYSKTKALVVYKEALSDSELATLTTL